MFTGIVETMGTVRQLLRREGDVSLEIASADMSLDDVQLGDSIAINGVCLTVTALQGTGFSADVSVETMDYTSIGQLQAGSSVNLEKALMPTSRLGGHIVSGHVDGVGEVIERFDDARSVRMWVQAPAELARYIAHKGSITIDGVSLTVNKVDGARFELNIIPHTAERTLLMSYRPGRRVNIEVDVIARYLERLLTSKEESAPTDEGMTLAKLAESGFLK
ncbi:riboflavin synthase alpha chain [Sinobacterium caligoides]|uniref:Riboflavin synthase n=1 Tax=Sinobacterium caligoides TaxID=933926 RepID=A0A3N2DPC4_9GAMM|nr:riboflavin synthase [Sinobacterium caligoides]ROS01630.1 riboflavin synthase alpha chain [Sinobacterium caligoides]